MFGNEELVKYIEINFCSLGLGTNCKYSLRIRRSFVQNDKALSHLPNEMAKSITCDRGQRICELAKHREKTKLRDVFCRSVLCVEKGTNENSNGLLREFYPKGRNLSRVSEKTLKKNLALINARPKKILNYQTPADLFEQELNKVLHLV